MNHSDDYRAKTEVQPVRVFVEFSVGVEMPVGVRSGAASVNMRMSMEMKVLVSDLIQHPDSEHHKHYCDSEFETFSDSMRDLEIQKNDEASTEGQGKSVAGPPKEADPATPEKTFLAAEKCRYGNDVIRICRVLQAQKKAQSQDREKRGFHFAAI
jgi:hypothetical protein